MSFEAVAREFHSVKISSLSPQHAATWLRGMEKDSFPWIGSLPLPQITAPLLLQTLRKVEARGLMETAHRLRQNAGQVLRYGVVTGRCERNPAPDLHGALKPLHVKHMAAVLDPAQAALLMKAIHAYLGQPITRWALLLSALLFQRPGNIRAMEWKEVDLEAALWTIPAAKMKRTISRHGRTIMVEKLNIQPDVIEAQLAHGKSGPLGAAYDRAEFMTQRRQMMRVWADYLDELRLG